MKNDVVSDRESLIIELLLGKGIRQNSIRMLQFSHENENHSAIIIAYDRTTHEILGNSNWSGVPFNGTPYEITQPPIKYFGCISKVPRWYGLSASDEQSLRDKYGVVDKKRKRFEESNNWASEIRIEFNDIEKLYNAVLHGIWLGNTNFRVHGWVFGPKACYKCLDQQHYTEDCALGPDMYLCFKCGGHHHTREHTRKSNGNEAYKCIVCNANHPAFSDTCLKLANMITKSNQFQIKLFKYLDLVKSSVEYINTRSNLFQKEEIYLESFKMSIRDISTKETIQQYSNVLGGSMREELKNYIDRKFDDIKNDFYFNRDSLQHEMNELKRNQDKMKYEQETENRQNEHKAEVRHSEILNAIKVMQNQTQMPLERAKSTNNLHSGQQTQYNSTYQTTSNWPFATQIQSMYNLPNSNSAVNLPQLNYNNSQNHNVLFGTTNNNQIQNNIEFTAMDLTDINGTNNQINNNHNLANNLFQNQSTNNRMNMVRSNSTNFQEIRRNRYSNEFTTHYSLNSTVRSDASSFFYNQDF